MLSLYYKCIFFSKNGYNKYMENLFQIFRKEGTFNVFNSQTTGKASFKRGL